MSKPKRYQVKLGDHGLSLPLGMTKHTHEVIDAALYDKAVVALKFIEEDRNLNERPHLVARKVLIKLNEYDPLNNSEKSE